jgi:FkbH-like protein
MSKSLYKDLGWLPAAPADFSAQCRAALQSDEQLGERLRLLASYSLNDNQLITFARTISKAQAAGRSLTPLVPFKLGVLSNSTLDLILPALAASAARYGIALDCIAGGYDQILQEAIAPGSTINQAKPDAVLLAIDFRGLQLGNSLGNDDLSKDTVAAALSYLQTIRAAIRTNSGTICILQTFAPPPERLFGSFDRVLAGTWQNLIQELNRGLAESIRGTEDVLLDVAGLAETVGLADWHSPAQWNLAKLPFAQEFLPLYADHAARTIGALRGKSKRCLILDLDNTVWGGVIGDDDLEGISCSQGDPTGEAYLHVQRLALALWERGVVLAVSSKNHDEIARLPFKAHPDMLLREEHFAVFQANWNDKATNIRAIAAELSLGLDSMVLLDDNPFERNLIRQLLPQVAVPELPDDPALYARTLAAAGYFESVFFSEEDRNRASFYQGNARRVLLQQEASNLDAFLTSLNMEITFQPFDRVGRARIAQLINKSNQFNLTTRRYTESEVAAIEADPDCFTLQVRLSDCFGDNGMISVVICRRISPIEWEIDTWLMSCRVLGRGVENTVLSHILARAREDGIRRLKGIYRPTGRNKLVENHYSKFGFQQVGSTEDGTTIWELAVSDAVVEAAPMVVRTLESGVPSRA